jgi:hypothetical protein
VCVYKTIRAYCEMSWKNIIVCQAHEKIRHLPQTYSRRIEHRETAPLLDSIVSLGKPWKFRKSTTLW